MVSCLSLDPARLARATSAALVIASLCALPLAKAEGEENSAGAGAEETVRLFIREFRIQGAEALPAADVQRAVYPYLGPGRTPDDVEAARVALETLYRERGFQAASVEVPPQRARRGLIVLRVTEGSIGRVRVVGSRYHEPAQIRSEAPALVEGAPADFNAISRDIVALNRQPDRRVIPEVRPGEQPGVLDIDLRVEDSLPLTASAELNDRYSAGTSKLRLNLAASYDNLWQLGHSVSANVQTSPLEWNEVLVYTGTYTARLASLPEWTFALSATQQDTDISTLGGAASAGRGNIIGLRATRVLPGSDKLFHSVSFGIDRKDYDQDVTIAGDTISTPVLYHPLSLTYGGFIDGESAQTEFFTGATLHFRGLDSGSDDFDLSRTNAEPNFAILRADVTHTRDLPGGFALVGRAQAQLASGALLANEQMTGGGIDTVRGYLEGEVVGDHGLFGRAELVSPDVLGLAFAKTPDADAAEPTMTPVAAHELRFLVFADGGMLRLSDALPEQDDNEAIASIGFGARFRLFRNFNGYTYFALPLVNQSETESGDARIQFSVKGSY